MTAMAFPDQKTAETAQAEAFAALTAEMIKLGFELDENGAIIGRNAASTTSDAEACLTTAWAEIQEAPTGEFWFEDPGTSPKLEGKIDTEAFAEIEAGRETIPPSWQAKAAIDGAKPEEP